MEIQLIYGPNNSGKSKYAEDVAVASGNKLVYLATMIPQNEENQKRIEKHRIQRQDKGFRTIEAGWNISDLEVDLDTVVLLEDASNLVANGIFMHGADADIALQDIIKLAKRCRKLIVVSIGGLVAEGYDAETTHYIDQLNWLNKMLENLADEVIKTQIAPEGTTKFIIEKKSEKHFRYFCNRECEYFPCHEGADRDNFNCLFCYCPLYVLGDDCGGEFRYTRSGKKDCSKCLYPHRQENYTEITKRYKEIEALVKKNGSIIFFVGLTLPRYSFSKPSASLDRNLRQCLW